MLDEDPLAALFPVEDRSSVLPPFPEVVSDEESAMKTLRVQKEAVIFHEYSDEGSPSDADKNRAEVSRRVTHHIYRDVDDLSVAAKAFYQRSGKWK